MDNNFRIINDDQNQVFYVAKAGLASGDSAERRGNRGNPLPGVAEFLASAPSNGLGIVGTGTYRWGSNFAYGSYGSDRQNLVADGYVQLLGDGQTRFASLISSGSTYTGLEFTQFAGFNFRSYGYGNPVVYRQCVFRVLPEFAAAPNSGVSSADGYGGAHFEDCLFFNVNFGSAQEASCLRCLFFNCASAVPLGSLTDCYLDPTCALRTLAASGNNVDPAANPAAGQGLSIGNAGFALASPGGLSAAPGFNNPSLGDFSLRADSPHLAAGIGPAQWRAGRSFAAQFLPAAAGGEAVSAGNTRFVAAGDDAPAVPVLATDGVLDSTTRGGLVIRASECPTGLAGLRTGRILHADAELPYEISQLTALGGYNFDTSYPALESQLNPRQPEVYNNNVFTRRADAAGTAGRNPARLTYGIRWSTLPDPRPDQAGDWVTGDTFVECEWNTRPLYDPATLLGNGDPAFAAAQAESIVCTWYQLLLGLSNVYYH